MRVRAACLLLVFVFVCANAKGESHYGTGTSQQRYENYPGAPGSQSGPGPCGVIRPGPSQASAIDPPANYSTAAPTPPKTESVQKRPVKLEVLVPSGNTEDCKTRMQKAAQELSMNSDRDGYTCQVSNQSGEKIFSDDSHNWCNSWDPKTKIRTSAYCSENWSKYVESLSDKTCDTDPLESGAKIKCDGYVY